jgi:hypothetical protein
MLFLVPAVFSNRSITPFSAAEKALLMASTILFKPAALPAPKWLPIWVTRYGMWSWSH